MKLTLLKKFLLKALSVGFIWTIMLPVAWSHARLVSPAPRDLNAGNKVGPCGVTVKPAVATHQFTAGQQIQIQITETIDHPGKYLIYFSEANDQNFQQYFLGTVPDVQGQPLPHSYTTTVTLPNVACDNCTLQMIQSMEENPANPSFYYSCADVRLVANNTTPPPVPGTNPPPGNGGGGATDVSSQGVSGSQANPAPMPGFGCGRINVTNGPGGPNGGLMVIALFLLPLLILIMIRPQAQARVKISRRTFRR